MKICATVYWRACPSLRILQHYREETEALLARHEKALFWEKMASTANYVIVAIMVALWLWGKTPTAAMRQYFWPLACFVYFLYIVTDLRIRIYRSKVDLLKELKQVQLQILELKASLQMRSDV